MLITSFQIFTIGFGLSLAGPCLLSCLPVILAYTAGRPGAFRSRVGDILVFLSGRFIAYVLLGAVAGISAAALHRFTDHPVAVFYRPVFGLVSIWLGLTILFSKGAECGSVHKTLAGSGLFAAGFVTGMSPCAPLFVLLSEIVLISRHAWQGAWYGAAFGLGTFTAAFLVTTGISGILYRLTGKYLVSAGSMRAMRLLSSAILIVIGIFSLSLKKSLL